MISLFMMKKKVWIEYENEFKKAAAQKNPTAANATDQMTSQIETKTTTFIGKYVE